MEDSTSIVPILFLVTFAIAIVIGIIQYRKVIASRRERHRSASAVANGEPRTPAGDTGRREPTSSKVG